MAGHLPTRAKDPTLVDQPLALPASERTLVDPPVEDGLARARSSTGARGSTSDRVLAQPTVPPVIPDIGIEKRLDPNSPGMVRYVIGELLGTGSSSHVYAGHDCTFDREVAIKFLEAGLAQDARRLSRFVREARMTARLDHPNIVPVYELNATPAGDLYLTMRQVKGLSLGDAVRRATEGDLPPELGDMYQRVNILLKVCDALACAHDRGIAHLDVKPDNIMLGLFGEVVVVDWGLARRFDEEPRARQHISGTPAYMSPEQSAGHPGDALADIYCLGATLFHVLTLRHPTWGSDETEFWAKKRAGTIDPPTAAERARIPKRLLAIALKALAVDRGDRYQTVKALGEDLQHYQAGLAVSAYRETWLERANRWHRRHARPLWTGVVAAAAVIASALYVYGERLKEVVAWGSPIYRQSFSDDSWRADFIDVDDVHFRSRTRWERQDGRIVSLGPRANWLILHRRLYGPVAVEFEGEMLPGHPPCDLSLGWTANDPAKGNEWFSNMYRLQTGAYDNTFAAISSPGTEIFARAEVRLEPGVRYRLRFEIDEDRLSIDLDGRRICQYHASFPCTSGYVGLYGFYPGKAFDNVTVYAKGVPQRVSPAAIGDFLYQRDQPLEAAEQYRLVSEAFAGSSMGDQARYKQGLCLAKMGRKQEALVLWNSLHERAQINLAECLRIEWTNDAGDVAGAVARFVDLYRDDPSLRPRLLLLFANAIDATIAGKRPAMVDQWVALTSDLLPSDLTVDTAAAKALYSLGRWETVVERYPHIEKQAFMALLALGRPDEVLHRFPGINPPWMKQMALFELGRFDESLRNHSDPSTDRDILQLQGRYEEALALAGDNTARSQNLIWLGRSAEALAEAQPGSSEWYVAMIHLGRIDEALAAELAAPDSSWIMRTHLRRYDELIERARIQGINAGMQLHLGRWLQALERHDAAAARVALTAARLPEVATDQYHPWFMRFIGVPFVNALGDRDAFRKAMQTVAQRGSGWLSQRPWHAARYLLGEIDEAAYLAQPARGHAPAALLVLRAMRAELAGNREAASGDYRAYLTLPQHLRSWDSVAGDMIVDQFVTWRLAELGG